MSLIQKMAQSDFSSDQLSIEEKLTHEIKSFNVSLEKGTITLTFGNVFALLRAVQMIGSYLHDEAKALE